METGKKIPLPSNRVGLAALGLAATLTAASVTGCSSEAVEIREDKTFDNIIVLISDDHQADVMGKAGDPLVRTPNLDSMADDGVYFTNAICNAAVCAASRQSILTGKYPHATGVTQLRTSFPDKKNTTIAEHLKGQGFKTGVIGKTHFNNQGTHGFDYIIRDEDYDQYLEENPPREIPSDIETNEVKLDFSLPASEFFNSRNLPAPHYEEDSHGRYFVNKAIDFIKDNKDDRFCLWVGFHEPHTPFYYPVEYAGRYTADQITLPEGSPEDDRWIPEYFKDMTDEEMKGTIAAYYTAVEYMDTNIGLLLDALRKEGMMDNTLVVYISDQGYLLGEHKRLEKHTMWEEVVQAPLVMNAQGRYPAGTVVDTMVGFVDLVPTWLELLGAPFLDEVQGESFADIIDDPGKEHKKFTFNAHQVDDLAMVRSQNWKYVFTSGVRDLGQGYYTGYGPSGIVHRLYNLAEDPGETTSLADDPEYSDKLKEMKMAMLDWFKTTHMIADELPEGLTIDEQLAWFARPVEGLEPRYSTEFYDEKLDNVASYVQYLKEEDLADLSILEDPDEREYFKEEVDIMQAEIETVERGIKVFDKQTQKQFDDEIENMKQYFNRIENVIEQEENAVTQ